MKLTVLFLLLLTACGKPIGMPNEKFGIDPAFVPYVEEYERLYEVQILHIPIHFRDLKDNIIGVCYIFSGEANEIFIDEEKWNIETERGRLAVVFHEIEHCYRNQGHRDFLLSDKCAGSLMNTYQPTQTCLVKHWDYYTEELRW